MQVIEASYIQHRGETRILLRCAIDAGINAIINRLPGRRYSKTYRGWHLPCNKEAYLQFKKQLPAGWCIIENKAGKPEAEVVKNAEKPAPAPAVNKKTVPRKIFPISENNQQELDRFITRLKLESLAGTTLRTYKNEFSALLRLLGNKPVQDLVPDDLTRYLLYCIDTLKLKENSVHSRLNALKYYFENILKRDKFFFEIPRPKKQVLLPKIFNQDELARIINATENKKHKAMLMLSYSAGLRVSEVVNIKTQAIDSRSMTIFISQAKGKKDRVAALSPVLLVMLREYAVAYKPAKDGYLFEGNVAGKPYSTRSLQEVLQAAKKRAGIVKPGSIHSLRHSFATHLIDNGTDVTMIQKLLGHNDLKTTLRYLHTTNRDLLKIVSPLDGLDLK